MSFQAYIDNIKTKTGKTPEDFKNLAEKKGLLEPGVKAGEIIGWLKKDFDLGHGHAMAVYSVLSGKIGQRINKVEAIDKHFANAKVSWRPVFDAVLNKIKKFGNDISISPVGSYISILREDRKIAVVQITKERMDIGIKLKGFDTTSRFETAGSWNSMMTHRVRISAIADVDKELLDWLKNAYEQNVKK